MKIEHTQVFGFEASLRACRNPMDSWSKSDSKVSLLCLKNSENFVLGEKDKILSQKLTKAGSEHCKHLRLIQVWVDLTLPRYIHQELDTYKHVEKISCSTIHTLMKNDLTSSMFENGDEYIPDALINEIQKWIDRYQESTDPERKKLYKIAAKSLLPESFLQKRTINTNYQQLLNIYHQRKNHQLPEWHEICNWIVTLPYFTELTGLEIVK